MNFNSKILVTGSAGFLGNRIVYKLCESGFTNIRCFIRSIKSIQKFDQIRSDFPKVSFDFCEGNLTNQVDADKAVNGVSIIIHCASGKSGTPAGMYFDTVVATRNLLEAAKNIKQFKRIVHVSSFAVYGTASLKRRAIINEDTPLEENFKKRNDSYSYVKLHQENIVKKYGEEFDLPFVIVRPGVVYGPEGDEISARVGVRLFGLFLNIGKNNLLPLSYVDNCSEAIIKAAVVPDINGEIFNIHDNDLRTCNQFLRGFKKRVKKIKSIKVPYVLIWLLSWFVESYAHASQGQIPAAFTRYKTASIWGKRRFDNGKLRRLLEWSPSISTDEGLSNHYRYFYDTYSKIES